jgi:hypothetical protein
MIKSTISSTDRKLAPKNRPIVPPMSPAKNEIKNKSYVINRRFV